MVVESQSLKRPLKWVLPCGGLEGPNDNNQRNGEPCAKRKIKYLKGL